MPIETVTPQWMIEQGYSPSIAIRFWNKVQKTPTCWLWTASVKQGGYGYISWKRSRSMLASRLSWMLHFGPIPDTLHVLHDCPGGDNPRCVNPDHLWLGYQRDNCRDTANKGRSTRGEKNAMHKLTENEVRLIKTTRPYRGFVKELAAQYHVRHSAISRILHGHRWNHVEI